MPYSIRTRCVSPNCPRNGNLCTSAARAEGGNLARESTGAVAVPIFQTAAFSHPALGQSTGFDYSRASNPTREAAENAAAALEGAKYAFAFSSGMAAAAAVFDLLGMVSPLPQAAARSAPSDFKAAGSGSAGIAVIASEDLYGGAIRLFNTIEKRNGINVIYTDTTVISNIENAICTAQKAGYKVEAVYIETPSNPMMLITDIRQAAAAAHKAGAMLVADNTFMTPYFQRPLELGADIAVQSGTKFLAGHNDTLAGIITANRDDIAGQLAFNSKTTGACLSPFDSFLLIRGIKTLAVRLDVQQQNAIKIVKAMQNIKCITKVMYPGLESHPGYKINKAQSQGFGSMISFYVDSPRRAERVLSNVRLIRFAESLGGVESLITYPLTQTHADLSEADRKRRGINDCLLRLSVGIEDSGDLIDDIVQSLGAV